MENLPAGFEFMLTTTIFKIFYPSICDEQDDFKAEGGSTRGELACGRGRE